MKHRKSWLTIPEFNRMTKAIILIIAVPSMMLVAGCSNEKLGHVEPSDDVKLRRINDSAFAAPEYAGTLPDGRRVYFVEHRKYLNNGRHTIYFIDDNSSVTSVDPSKFSIHTTTIK